MAAEKITALVGKVILTAALSFGGATVGFLVQFGRMDIRITDLEVLQHPPMLYRQLQDERNRNLQDSINSLRRDLERHRRHQYNER